jgi:hypothetical protein
LFISTSWFAASVLDVAELDVAELDDAEFDPVVCEEFVVLVPRPVP